MGNLVQQFDLQVKTQIEDLDLVIDWFSQFDRPPVPHWVWLECQLALAEGFTNAVRHAHRHRDPETPIFISVRISEVNLQLHVWDQGDPFDLLGALQGLPDVFDAEQEGGRGLLLLRKIATQLSYSRDAEGRNCLMVDKSFVRG
ncbi:MAG: ATP-binding protein [Synechococcales cyanobacterium]